MTTQTTNENQGKGYATGAEATQPYVADTKQDAYAPPAKPHACHCGPESPCKKDGICRCKLVRGFQANLEAAVGDTAN